MLLTAWERRDGWIGQVGIKDGRVPVISFHLRVGYEVA